MILKTAIIKSSVNIIAPLADRHLDSWRIRVKWNVLIFGFARIANFYVGKKLTDVLPDRLNLTGNWHLLFIMFAADLFLFFVQNYCFGKKKVWLSFRKCLRICRDIFLGEFAKPDFVIVCAYFLFRYIETRTSQFLLNYFAEQIRFLNLVTFL